MNLTAILPQTFKNFCDEIRRHPIYAPFKGLPKIFNSDAEAVLKVTQIGSAILGLLFLRNPQMVARYANFSITLAAIGMQDVFRIIKRPLEWVAPIRAQSIDENAVAESITYILYPQYYPADNDVIDANNLRALNERVKTSLAKQLSNMIDTNCAYPTFEKFQQDLELRLKREVLDTANLTGLTAEMHRRGKQPLRHVTLGDYVKNMLWTVVDIGSVVLRLQTWQVIDTAKWTASIGQYRALKWVQNAGLETLLVGSVCATFALEFWEAARKLCDDFLTPQQKERARRDMITSVAETALFGAILLVRVGQADFTAEELLWLALIVKTIGLCCIKTAANYEFFQQPARAA